MFRDSRIKISTHRQSTCRSLTWFALHEISYVAHLSNHKALDSIKIYLCKLQRKNHLEEYNFAIKSPFLRLAISRNIREEKNDLDSVGKFLIKLKLIRGTDGTRRTERIQISRRRAQNPRFRGILVRGKSSWMLSGNVRLKSTHGPRVIRDTSWNASFGVSHRRYSLSRTLTHTHTHRCIGKQPGVMNIVLTHTFGDVTYYRNETSEKQR